MDLIPDPELLATARRIAAGNMPAIPPVYHNADWYTRTLNAHMLVRSADGRWELTDAGQQWLAKHDEQQL